MTESGVAATKPTLPPQAELFEMAQGYWRCCAVTVAAELEIADHLASAPFGWLV